MLNNYVAIDKPIHPIKFSHKYFKLGNLKHGDLVRLVMCETLRLENQSEAFLEYDTGYPVPDKDECGTSPETCFYEPLHYPLPKKGTYLLLGFMATNGMFFTTLRRAYPDAKVLWYFNQLREWFRIEMTEESK